MDRIDLERRKVTVKRLSVGELAQHLSDSNPTVRDTAVRAAKEMATFEISDPDRVNIAPLRGAYMRFQMDHPDLMPTQGGVNAVVRAILDLHAVRKKIGESEEGKKPKRFEL